MQQLDGSIAERQQIDQARLANEEEYHALADAMPQIVWSPRPDGDLDYYNQRWFDYTGTTLEETQGRGWEMMLHPNDLLRSVDNWTQAVRSGCFYEDEYRFKRAADGVYRWHLARAVPIYDADGTILKWIGTCTDIAVYQKIVERHGGHIWLESEVGLSTTFYFTIVDSPRDKEEAS